MPAICTPRNAPVEIDSDAVAHMLLEVLNRVEVQARARNAGTNEEEVVIDTEVNGIRYLVIRMPRAVQTPVQLSPREQEIVRMVAQGHPNKVIADVLNISSWTVCTHLRRIFAKLGVGSRAAMVAQCSRVVR